MSETMTDDEFGEIFWRIQARKRIHQAIIRERKYQEEKWGNNPHEVIGWIAIMRAELNEAEHAWIKEKNDNDALREILQVIAVGVACLEQYGVKERKEET